MVLRTLGVTRGLLAALVVLAVAAAGCHSKAASSSGHGGQQADQSGTALAATGPLPAPEPGDIPANDSTPPLAGALSLGPAGTPQQAAVTAAGATVSAGGLSIVFAPGAVTADVAGTVTTAPIMGVPSGAYGGAITPITDLYTIDLGGAALTAPATVTLAIPPGAPTVPGAVAMAFYYNAQTGEIWPLATAGGDATAIVALAPHFSSVFGALVDLAKLPTTVDSGFRPGQDDWQFTNYGSYVAPHGHCEGQVVSELWYYTTQRQHAGASGLYGLYDNNGAPDKTPTFWPDDSDGYRLASTVQADPIAVPNVYQFMIGWDAATKTSQGAPAAQTYALLRVAMAISGQPQELAIQDATATSHHAILAYRVTPTTVYVADPNYPAHLRTIHYDAATGKLGPYSSGDNAKSIAAKGQTVYTTFAYMPTGASAGDAALAARWAQFEAGTIGTGVFPSYALVVSTGQDAAGEDIWQKLTDGFTTSDARIKVALSALSDNAPSKMLVYPGTSSTATHDELFAWLNVDLMPGDNPLGFRVYGKVAATGAFEYVDFVRLTVKRSDAPVTVDASSGGHPVLVAFDGPTILNPKDLTIPYPFTTQVAGGTPPYHYRWEARGQLLTEGVGSAFANPTFTGAQLAQGSNGERYWIYLYVTDAKDHEAAWRRPDGSVSNVFAYGVDPGMGSNSGTVKEPPFPYTPANP